MGLDNFMDIDVGSNNNTSTPDDIEPLDGNMTLTQFKECVDNLVTTSSDKTKHGIIKKVRHDKNAIAILAGQRFDDNGVGKITALKAYANAYSIDRSRMEDVVSEEGSITEAIEWLDKGSGDNDSLANLYEDCLVVSEKSGNSMVSHIALMYKRYTYPSMVSYALLDDLTTGVTEKSIANAVAAGKYSKDEIVTARALVPDAVEFIEAFDEEGLQLEPVVGTAFNPMLAHSNEPTGDMSEWLAQYKIDGYRLLIHVKEDDVIAFTRNLEDVTHSLPELDNIEWPDGEFIFDCEVVADDGTYKTTSKRIGSKHQTVGTMNFAMFDLIYANEHIGKKPLEHRLEQLRNYVPDSERTLAIPTGSIDEIKPKALELEFEGIILKRKGSHYKYGKRSKDWRKVKFTREHADLVMAEFIRQKGEDTNTLGAIRLETSDGHTIGKVGTGWNDKQAKQLWKEKPVGEVAEISFEGLDDKIRFPVFERRKQFGNADDLDRVKELADGY